MAPLIVITGPTASGKSSLALRLAEKWGGEIICADSRTVYKGMDIGTAKPSPDDRALIPHHLLDVARPSERFTAHHFQKLATQAIGDIRARGQVPFLVGGSGLYIDSVVLGLELGPDRDVKRRQLLEQLTVNELQTMLKKQHISLPENAKNKRYLIRALEIGVSTPSVKTQLLSNTHVVAITTNSDALRLVIHKRVEAMFDSGVIDETNQLAVLYGWECEAMTGNIYAIVHKLQIGELSLQEAIEQCTTRDRKLAKRQVTWLKRHDYINWLSTHEAEHYVDHILTAFRDSNPQ